MANPPRFVHRQGYPSQNTSVSKVMLKNAVFYYRCAVHFASAVTGFYGSTHQPAANERNDYGKECGNVGLRQTLPGCI
jgi:hypothetical protein